MTGKVEKVTLKTVADEAGVSIGTVSRALNNSDGINAKTRRMVLSIADKLNYPPKKKNGTPVQRKPLTIGLAYPEVSPDFYSYIEKGVTDAALELAAFGVTVEKIRYNVHTPEDELARLRSLDLSRYDGLAINSAGPAIESLIDEITSSGLPVITFNTDAAGSSRLFYVGSNTRQSGMMGAEILSILMGGSGKVAVLGDFTRASPFIERFGGFCEYVQANYPDIMIHPCAHASSYADTMTQRLIEQINLIPDIGGVFCTGHTGTIGTLAALQTLDRRDIRVVGYDVTSITADALREGLIDALIFQDPYQQGYQAAHLLSRHLIEGYLPPQPCQYIENRLVLKSNLDNYDIKVNNN